MVNARIPAMERLLASRPTNQTGRPWYEFRNADANDDGPVELFIYDVIDDWFGVSAEMFARDLSGIDAEEITVRINSPGGNVFDGIAILNALRGHKARVTTVVDGLAASAASFIAMAGDEVVMNRNAEMMIHDASGVCIGNAKDMAEMHDMLERVSNNIASIYAERTGTDVQDWRDSMLAETWYSAEEAVAAGLADRVESDDKDAEKAKNSFDLSIFNYAGRDKAPTPTPLAATGAPEVNRGKEANTMATLNEGLAERLGIPADADDETILSALDEALAERATDNAAGESANSGGQALPDGVVAIDAATLSELQAQARRGEEARVEQERAARVAAVDNAVRTGRIAPAQRETWLNRLQADPTEAQVLDSLAPVYPVGRELGHAGTPTTNEDDGVYEALFGKEA